MALHRDSAVMKVTSSVQCKSNHPLLVVRSIFSPHSPPLLPLSPAVLRPRLRASRGIDSLDVSRIVLFDFPRDPSEYVRRVGRTARGAGGTGTVFALVMGGQVGLARRIMARSDRGLPIHDVPE